MKGFSNQIDAVVKELHEAEAAASILQREIKVSFDPTDPVSVDRAISDVRREIDSRASPYSRNQLAVAIFESAKQNFERDILDKVAAVQQKPKESERAVSDVNQVLREVENTIHDLRRSDYKGFSRFIAKLHKQLNSDELIDITEGLKANIDLKAWVEDGLKSQRGTVGSARLNWPAETEKELGLVIALTEAFALKKESIFSPEQFSFQFYYQSNKFNDNIGHMVDEVYVPFGRDFVEYVKGLSQVEGDGFQRRPEIDVSVRKVFIVHGHDNESKQTVARFFESLDFEPIILHEQASGGRTIIEKIEAYDQVGFAVVLLTPDDVGASKNDESNLKPRARQNVIAELGYFVARLGRSRVVALKRGELEVPSDFDGVIYIPIDSGEGWKLKMSKELDAAGYDIDFNKVIGKNS